MSTHNHRSKGARLKSVGIYHCESCGYKEHAEALTIHHIFKRRDFEEQPSFPRKYRYAVLCANCHLLVEMGITNSQLKAILIARLTECQLKFGEHEYISQELFKLGAWRE